MSKISEPLGNEYSFDHKRSPDKFILKIKGVDLAGLSNSDDDDVDVDDADYDNEFVS